ncbi:hypothetical protein FJO69_01975 [[Mycoplasma] falconis]|uniref:Uncharacterized protein n=1 Tax=[Mycoplasma] falconis TaxID=92403 RepID=A0A501XAJ1_9BACT|nr:hypothetical protein [[Mycoplasma] falconis]TPE57373.1 hypothetical protein FJO69_01975 [[Mycoplasma] falconis]
MKWAKWTKKQKATLFIGISLLVIIMLTTILKWHVYAGLYYDRLNAVKIQNPEAFELMIKNQAIPPILSIFWSINFTFTWISNLGLGITCVLFAIFYHHKYAKKAMFLTVVFISVTFLVYWTLIFPESIKRFQPLNGSLSIIMHLINPIIGFIVLGINRKNIEITTLTIWLTDVVALAYYFFALIAFYSGIKLIDLDSNPSNESYRTFGLTVYSFLNFEQPLFYKGDSIAIKIFLNLAIVIFGLLIFPAIAYFWKAVYKIKLIKLTKKNKSIENKTINKLN